MKKRGFTLVELLAVIAILAILVIMALPAVLRMFNNARRDSFTNEVNTVIRTARQQYLLSGGQAKTYSNAEGSTNTLNLTGNSRLKYLATIDGNGKITKLQVTNGDFQYDVTNNAGIDIVESSDVKAVSELEESEILVITKELSFVFVNRQEPSSITVGDEVAFGTEHFYVISSNATETVLLSKYNLHVGNSFYRENKNSSNFTLIETISSADPNYCLQNPAAMGSAHDTDLIAVVPFSGINYWHSSKCQETEDGWRCTVYSYEEPYPVIYDSTKSTVAPLIDLTGYARTRINDYSVAYYVEEYIRKLKSMGASSNITGRLLLEDEAIALGCQWLHCEDAPSWLTSTSYWIGNARTNVDVLRISNGVLSSYNFFDTHYHGLRPIVVVPTSEMLN